MCAGKTLSKIQMFVFAISLLHTYNIEVLNNEDTTLTKGTMIFSVVPNHFNVKVTEKPDTQDF